MCKIIGITNRHLVSYKKGNDSLEEYFARIEEISRLPLEAIIVREKDLPEEEYRELAQKVLEICGRNHRKCILHSFCKTAVQLQCPYIHLPLEILRKHRTVTEQFREVGISVHSAEEAKEAQALGAAYVTAGHIFATDCKKGLAPRGLPFLQSVCESVEIPVYAIGGINMENIKSVIQCGAKGGCVMSGVMSREGIRNIRDCLQNPY